MGLGVAPFKQAVITWEIRWFTYTQPVLGLIWKYWTWCANMEYVMAAFTPWSLSWAVTRRKLVPMGVSSLRKSWRRERYCQQICSESLCQDGSGDCHSGSSQMLLSLCAWHHEGLCVWNQYWMWAVAPTRGGRGQWQSRKPRLLLPAPSKPSAAEAAPLCQWFEADQSFSEPAFVTVIWKPASKKVHSCTE